jgi:hypothetical protein
MTPLILINVFLAVCLAAFGLGVLLLQRDPAFRRRVQQLLVEPSAGPAGGQRARRPGGDGGSPEAPGPDGPKGSRVGKGRR